MEYLKDRISDMTKEYRIVPHEWNTQKVTGVQKREISESWNHNFQVNW